MSRMGVNRCNGKLKDTAHYKSDVGWSENN
jgi:hypothetical protein